MKHILSISFSSLWTTRRYRAIPTEHYLGIYYLYWYQDCPEQIERTILGIRWDRAVRDCMVWKPCGSFA